jgi:hypothetical protein
MSKVDLETLASPMLIDGERVVAGVRVNWNGMVAPTRATTPLQMGLGPDEEMPVLEPDELVEFPSAKQLALVLTGGRLLAWSLGISGKPKQYLGDVPLSAVTDVEAGEVQFGSLIRISLRSGAVVDLEAMRGEPGEQFSSALQHLTTDG